MLFHKVAVGGSDVFGMFKFGRILPGLFFDMHSAFLQIILDGGKGS